MSLKNPIYALSLGRRFRTCMRLLLLVALLVWTLPASAQWTDPSSGITYSLKDYNHQYVTVSYLGNANQTAFCITDGSADSKYCLKNMEMGHSQTNKNIFVVIETSEPINLTGYTMITGNDDDFLGQYVDPNGYDWRRRPMSWRIEGSMNNSDWTPLVTVVGDSEMGDYNFIPYTFDCTTTGQYKYFKLIIDSIQGTYGYFQLSEFYPRDYSKEKFPVRYYGNSPSKMGYKRNSINTEASLEPKRGHASISISGSMFTQANNSYNASENKAYVNYTSKEWAISEDDGSVKITVKSRGTKNTAIHSYLYIENANASDFSASSLVATGVGELANGLVNWSLTIPADKVPSEGLYRMRLKTELTDETSSRGGMLFIQECGGVSDIMLRVYKPYQLTMVDAPDGSEVAVAGSVERQRTESGLIHVKSCSLSNSDITVSNEGNYEYSINVDNSTHTIVVTFYRPYSLTLNNPPASASVNIVGSVNGDYTQSGIVKMRKSSLEESDITVSSSSNNNYSVGLDNEAHTIIVSFYPSYTLIMTNAPYGSVVSVAGSVDGNYSASGSVRMNKYLLAESDISVSGNGDCEYRVSLDNSAHTIGVEFFPPFQLTMINSAAGASVTVNGSLSGTLTSSGPIRVSTSTIEESDVVVVNPDYYTSTVVVNNAARTITVTFNPPYQLTMVDAPTDSRVTIAGSVAGSFVASGMVMMNSSSIADADVSVEHSIYYSHSVAIDNSARTITVTFNPPTEVHNYSQITNMSGAYRLADDFSVAGHVSIGTESAPFSGYIEGSYHVISGLTTPFFGYLNDATIVGVILDNVDISGTGKMGALARVAGGNTRIYNCGVLASGSEFGDADEPFESSSTVEGTVSVGGIVGEISGNTRVLNCFSYADVTGDDYTAGIVGRYTGSWCLNSGTAVNGTGNMVMNCMVYGDIDGGNHRSPVVGGSTFNSDISNYDYFRYHSISDVTGMAQNGALSVDEDLWLTRYEFFRSALNNHRDMAAIYCFNDASRMTEMAKWYVDKTKGPWPILKAHDQNTRKVIGSIAADAARKIDTMGTNGYLSVNIKVNGMNYSAQLPITGMDEANYDYTWGKVKMPFANEFYGWERNYDSICIGWEISSLTGGTVGSLADYDFADRNCTAKDEYDATNNPFIYAQGGYFVVPYGVTAISIRAHFAKAFYLCDAYYDMDQRGSLTRGGTRPGWYHGKTVYNSIASAWNAMASDVYSPHRQAIVLVGNYHYNSNISANYLSKGCTIMSVDEDNDQEPDYGWYFSLTGNDAWHQGWPSMRWDFIPMFGTGTFQPCGRRACGINLPLTRGWWELTETCILRTYEFEIYDSYRANADDGHGNNAWIFNGGYHQAMVRCKGNANDRLSYIKIGGNAFIKELFLGNHSNTSSTFTMRPVVVTGGEIRFCYMTGMANFGTQTVITNNAAQPNNSRFYCSGGKIGRYLSAYMEYPVNNVKVRIDHAIIDEFYGGGTNKMARVLGDIDVVVNNSYVGRFCGGPEFGDMSEGKGVVVSATNTTFGYYYGAGFGGTSLTRIKSTINNGETGAGSGTANNTCGSLNDYSSNRLSFNTTAGSRSSFEIETFMNARGDYYYRFFDYFALLSLAETGNVQSTLNNCTIEHDFYGGGCQGMVDGTITSTLNNCTVAGNVFGGGYKAQATAINVMNSSGQTFPDFNATFGFFTPTIYPETVTYTWTQGTSNGVVNESDHTISTTTPMEDMGKVTGDITLTLKGGTVAKNVFCGGNESPSMQQTTLVIDGTTVGTVNDFKIESGNVFGGGNSATVASNTNVTLKGSTYIYNNVYGGGNNGEVGGNTNVVVE